jgi:DNA-nicking Smr family endonuclease
MSGGKDERKGKGKGGKGGTRRSDGLSAEDAALWRLVTRDVRPTPGKARVRAVESGDPEAVGRARGEKAGAKKPSAPHSPRDPASIEAGARAGRHSVPAADQQPKSRTVAGPVEIERRKARRIARGAEVIDARLDLHGMTQDEAHRALTHFIHRCQAQSLKTVLVITGKGGAGGELSSGPAARARGVLRQNVPRWLNEPLLAALVIGYSAASVRHGGDGALYVRLRRRR